MLYVYEFEELDDAIALQNSVDQGLSSAIFTDSFYRRWKFLVPQWSDCGIANVSIGTSGEIGSLWRRKDTGGGRESVHAWKAYMRRQTCTMNWGRDLPLAPGIWLIDQPRTIVGAARVVAQGHRWWRISLAPKSR